MKLTSGWANRWWVGSCARSGTICSAPGGIPAASPASRSTSTTRSAQRVANGDGRKMIELRVFAATIALNSTVDVGFVIGVIARTVPMGSAT